MNDQTTPDPIRAALERLTIMAANELDTPGLWAHSRANWDDAIAAARAALAEPVAEGPTDEELDACADEFLDWNNDGIRAFARAVLARWGHQSANALPLPAPEGGKSQP